MKTTISAKPFLLILVTAITFCLSVATQSILAAWAPPSLTPPNGNVDAPVNIGLTTQTKLGSLYIGGSMNVVGQISAGSVVATSFAYSSDMNLKKNISTLSNSLENIMQIRGVKYNWKKDDSASIGVIAQEVEKVFPELVLTDKNTGLKSVQYGNLIAPLIEAVKEQQKEIEELKIEINSIKNKSY